MTKIKLCGLSRICDIEEANLLQPDYIGFVFAAGSRRRVSPEQAAALRAELSPAVRAVGVFVREEPEQVAALLNAGVIDLAQLHGGEDERYIERLRALTDRPLIQACSTAEHILLDNGAGGTGRAFDWGLLRAFERPFFLAGGLGPGNAAAAVRALRPFAMDVSSGVETDGVKDREKMRAFVEAVRKASGEEDGT